MENKLAILSFHRANNYGAVLQSYALCRVIRNIGGNPEIIDYWPVYFQKIYSHRRRLALNKEYFRSIFYIRTRKKLKIRNRGFEKFVREELPLSECTINGYWDMALVAGNYAAFLCGSDQVWNPWITHDDRMFFLDFPEAKIKFSYAASFGDLTYLSDELCSYYQERLYGYRSYSVREELGKIIISKLYDKNVYVHLDPGLLLSTEEWKDLACGQTPDEPYILIYCVKRTEKIFKTAQELSLTTGYRIILLMSHCSYSVMSGSFLKGTGIELNITASPKEFLALFRDANIVLTNSFHGIVFSVVFEKEFLLESVDLNGIENRRAINLLSMLELSDRVLKEEFAAFEKIDWGKVRDKLQCLRRESMEYLQWIVDSVNVLN